MSDEAKKDMEEKIQGLEDTGDKSESNNLLHRKIFKSKSGHIIEFNDNEGAEHISIRHRGGSMIQMQPDGSIRLVVQNGKLGIETNGESYLKTTGRMTVMADGDLSFRGKNIDMTATGDMTQTVKGKHTLTNKNMNVITSEKLDIGATDATMKAGEKMLLASAETTVRGRESTLVQTTGGDTTIKSSNKIQNTSDTLYHNEKSVGDTHEHTDVMPGSALTGPPV